MSQFCVSLRAGNTVSKHKWGYKLQTFPVTVPLDPLASYLHTAWNEAHLPAAKGLAWLGFFPYAVLFSQSLINADILLPPWW